MVQDALGRITGATEISRDELTRALRGMPAARRTTVGLTVVLLISAVVLAAAAVRNTDSYPAALIVTPIVIAALAAGVFLGAFCGRPST